MSLKYTCDLCGEDAEKHIRIGGNLIMYCIKCWMDKKNWLKIHEDAVKNSKY